MMDRLTRHSHALDDLSMDDLWDKVKGLVLAVWGRTTRRMRAAGAFILFL